MAGEYDDTRMVKATLAAGVIQAMAANNGIVFGETNQPAIAASVAQFTNMLFKQLFPSSPMPEVQVGGNPKNVRVRTR